MKIKNLKLGKFCAASADASTRVIGLACVVLLVLGLSGCDWNHTKKCEWYLMPDPDRIGKSDEGYIPVCARNLVINKENCYLQAKLSLTQEFYGKKFRMVDVEIDRSGQFPRTVTSIKACED